MRVLGIGGGFGHDASAALVVDGQIVAACEEERFTRQKRGLRQPPINAVEACLKAGGLHLSEVDFIAFGWDPALAPGDTRLVESLDSLSNHHRIPKGQMPETVHVAHHLAHAAATYYTSGFAEAAILVIDGQGERQSTTVFQGQGQEIREVATFGVEDSLGFFYAMVTRYLGFAPGSAGKTMGLAPWGSMTYDFPQIQLEPRGYKVQMPGRTKSERASNWMRLLVRVFGDDQCNHSGAEATGLLEVSRIASDAMRNAAASAQAALERAVLHLAELALSLCKTNNLALGGGVALNCTTNGRLRRLDPLLDLHVYGAAHDAGTAIGAALAQAAASGDLIHNERATRLFLGPEFRVGPTVDLAKRAGLQVLSGADETAARLIAGDKIGGWFRGPAEYGPRALGARSIVSRADDPAVRDRLNRIKGREEWRPVAPAMTARFAERLGLGPERMDFMIEARWPNDGEAMRHITGITHVDGSIRPLVVREDQQPFESLLRELENELGVGVVTNTSFNVEGEPIVNTPKDALRTFVASDLDFLALEDTVLLKH